MHAERKAVKTWIKNATRAEMQKAMRKALLSNEQKRIMLWLAKDYSCQSIAFLLNCDIATVYRKVVKLYRKLSFVEEG